MAAVLKEERKEERREEKMRNGFKGSRHHALKYAEQLTQAAQGGVDVGYLKTILFPELYNADVPQPLSTQSYCRFSDKKEFTINSKTDGMLLWFPKTMCGPQLFMRNLASKSPNEAKEFSSANWMAGGFMDYTQYFSQATLVSASIQIQYIGQLQNEQGFIVASQQFGTNPSLITADDIENGQFRLMEKPGDGVRCIYMPKDMNDFTYYSLQATTDTASTKIISSRNAGARPSTETVTYFAKDTTYAAATWIEGVVPTNTNGRFDSSGKAIFNISYAIDADHIAIYWKGLADPQANDLRIDVIRKFNGFPLAKHRDILDLQKPKKIFDPKKTIDVIAELQDNIPQLAGHSIKAMDRVSDEIQEFIPNVGTLYNEGMLKEGTSLRGFADQLQAANGMEGQVVVPGRLYD